MGSKEYRQHHLIVVAHPVGHSFTMGLADAYGDELEKLGHVRRISDPYCLSFDPVLRGQELVSGASGDAA